MGSRVPPDVRRRQLLAEAARLLTEHGLEQVQITELASRTNVSRPLVYRLFPTRQALLQAVLEDFAEFLGARFHEVLQRQPTASVQTIATAFVEACCDAIEQKGAGPWLLLDARGVEPELCELGRTIFMGLLGPWQEQLGVFLGVPASRASYVLWIIVAAGRATLAGWIEGTVDRADAVSTATHVVTALLVTFASQASQANEADEPTSIRARRR
ncbi:MAG: TetR/AcrR family transcriptional regulator [Myxococcales bacterium]